MYILCIYSYMYTYTQCYDNIYICVQYIHRYPHTCTFICSNVLYILHIINILMHDLNICGIINVTVLKHEAVTALIRDSYQPHRIRNPFMELKMVKK